MCGAARLCCRLYEKNNEHACYSWKAGKMKGKMERIFEIVIKINKFIFLGVEFLCVRLFYAYVRCMRGGLAL